MFVVESRFVQTESYAETLSRKQTEAAAGVGGREGGAGGPFAFPSSSVRGKDLFEFLGLGSLRG